MLRHPIAPQPRRRGHGLQSRLGRRLRTAAVLMFAATSITTLPVGHAGADDLPGPTVKTSGPSAVPSPKAIGSDSGSETTVSGTAGLTADQQFVQSVAAAPSNDNVGNAYALFADLPRTAYGTNENATKESGESWHAANPGGRSVWFRWTPAASGPVVIDTVGSSFDTLLGVYTGTPSALRAVASNDDIFESFTSRPRQSRLWLSVTAGTTYYIAVDGYGAEVGTVYLNLAWSGALNAVPSDQFANALPFNLVPGGVEQLVSNNINATGQAGEPLAAGYTAERSVWFTFVAPSAGSVSADTATSGFDTILDIFSGTTLTGLSPVANGSNDDAVNAQGAVYTRTSKVTGVRVAAGQRYYLRVAGYAGVQGVVNVDVGFVADGVATPPSAPTNVIATGGDGAITVTWTAPLSTGSQPITGYLVTANPGGATCSTGLLTCTVGGLTNGTPYTVTVIALSAAGQSQPSLAIPPVVPGSAGGYISLVPSRILDTRLNGGALSSGQTRDLEVVGQGGVPSSGVSAVVMNVTVTEPTNPGYVTVFPTGSNLPNASNLNFAPGQSVPNLVVAKVGAGGRVTLYNYGGTAHLIADVVGWVPEDDGVMRAMPPVRLMDTRSNGETIDDLFARFGALTTGRTENLAIAGRAGIPGNNVVDAVVLNVIAVGSSAPGYLSVFPTGEQRPTEASNLNFVAGQVVPNLVIAKLGSDGQVSIYNYGGTTDVVVDVVGWYPKGSGFVPTSPARLLDTRPSAFTVDGASSGAGAVGAGQVLNLTVQGRAGLPNSGVGAVVLNVTVTEPTAPSFVTAYPAGSPLPIASNLNFVPGQTVANLVVAKVGSNGQVSLYNLAGSTHLVADIVGWFPT
jgi:hypothetical protein